jgi:hypothetical protein
MRTILLPVRLPHSHIDPNWLTVGTNLLNRSVRTSGLHIRVKAGLVLCGHLLTFLEER